MTALRIVLCVASCAVLCLQVAEGDGERETSVSLQSVLTTERRGDDVSLQSLLTRERRNDDVSMQSLVGLVQQQAATIQRQEATMQQQEAVNQRQETAMQAMQAQVSQLHTSLTALKTPVSFTAQMSTYPVTMSSASPLRFENALSSVGGGYSAATGVFTAPEAGTYVFYAQLMQHTHSNSLTWAIYKAGVALCSNRAEGTVLYDVSSCLATTTMQKGEEVFVRHVDGDTLLEGGHWCSFSGFRLP